MNTNLDKRSIRAKAKHLRNSLDTQKYSDLIVNRIESWDKYSSAKNIMLYAPIQSEISLLNLLKDKSKNFYFPTIKGDEIIPVKYDCEKGFTTGQYGISEPIGTELDDIDKLDIVFYPALAADKSGYRVGYGKGYYDRFSSSIVSKTVKALPICSELVYEQIPYEQHDIAVDCLITEKSVIPTVR